MKRAIQFIFIVIVIIGCKQNTIIESFYPDGELKEKKILNSKNDTLNYLSYHYYLEGGLSNVIKYVNGLREGKYTTYFKNGNINTNSTYKGGKLNGIVHVFNDDGSNLRESYYVDGKQVIYSEFYIANSGLFEKQVFNTVIDGVAYPIGQLVKRNNKVQPDMSFYATISGSDTLTVLPYPFILEIFVPNEDVNFEISFGKPDKYLKLIEVDTSFISQSSRIELDNKYFDVGLNSIFCEINVLSEDTITFYAYKEIFMHK